MNIRIQFLGAMARLAGEDERTIEVPNPATVAAAVQKLAADPAIAGALASCTYSVAGSPVGASYLLREGGELVLSRD